MSVKNVKPRPDRKEEYLADEGDQCDSCGSAMKADQPFFGDDGLRVRWRFCSDACYEAGVTDKSAKARFIGAVLGG